MIAEHLHVSYKTVANTCTQLKAKLGVRTLPELMRIAIQHLPRRQSDLPNNLLVRAYSGRASRANVCLWHKADQPAGPRYALGF